MIARAHPLMLFAAISVALLGCGVLPALDPRPAASPTPVSSSEASLALEMVRDAVNSDPVNFGGAYLDPAGTMLTILVAGDDESAIAGVRRLVPPGANVVWAEARFSSADLRRISDEIVASWQRLGVDQISYVAVDVPGNQVVVTFPAANAQLEAQFRSKYGAAVVFQIEPTGKPL